MSVRIVDETGDRVKVSHPSGGRVLVKQGLRDATNINRIMDRWVHHKQPPVAGGGNPRYGDFSDGLSYHDCMNRVVSMEQNFQRLPASVRKHCHNDPGEFLDMVYDPDRVGELKQLGLLPEDMPPEKSAPGGAGDVEEPEVE